MNTQRQSRLSRRSRRSWMTGVILAAALLVVFLFAAGLFWASAGISSGSSGPLAGTRVSVPAIVRQTQAP